MDATLTCLHVWKKLAEHKYSCLRCNKEILSAYEIPCAHRWISIENDLGSNYSVRKCEYCLKLKVKAAQCIVCTGCDNSDNSD